MFSVFSKGHNMYHLGVLESLFIKTNKRSLCKHYFYKFNYTYCNFVTEFRFCPFILVLKKVLINLFPLFKVAGNAFNF